MGYRNYIGRIPKEVYEETKEMAEIDLLKKYGGEDYKQDPEDTIFVPYRNLPVEELYECGKYSDDRANLKRFFSEKMEYESDTEFWLGSKELLIEIINNYKKKVTSYYQEMFDSEDPTKSKDHFRNMLSEWTLNPLNMDEESPAISDSWKYEYQVFELVRLLKTFDWDNYVLFYYGH